MSLSTERSLMTVRRRHRRRRRRVDARGPTCLRRWAVLGGRRSGCAQKATAVKFKATDVSTPSAPTIPPFRDSRRGRRLLHRPRHPLTYHRRDIHTLARLSASNVSSRGRRTRSRDRAISPGVSSERDATRRYDGSVSLNRFTRCPRGKIQFVGT